jgi:hypothetical protein
LSENPTNFIGDFAREATLDHKNQRWNTVRNMARFAVAAAGGNPNNPAIAETVLVQSYNTWEDFPEIQGLFQSFVQGTVDTLTVQLNSIAGPRNSRDIRNFPTAEQVIQLRDHFGARFLPNRSAKRRSARTDAKYYEQSEPREAM